MTNFSIDKMYIKYFVKILHTQWSLLLICQKVVMIWRQKHADRCFADLNFCADEKVLICLFESANLLFVPNPRLLVSTCAFVA